MISLDGTEIKFDTFPNGDIYLKTNLNKLFADSFDNIIKNNIHNLYVKLLNSEDIMKLSIFMNAVRYYNWNYGTKQIVCHLLYCPYMQADKYIEEQTCAVSLDIITCAINNCSFKTVYIYGAHSNKVKQSIINSVLLYPNFPINSIDNKNIYICAPDEGAKQRALGFINQNIDNKNLATQMYIQGSKVRDKTTGSLSDFDVKVVSSTTGDECWNSIADHDVIIYDDVSVNGGTFSGIAKKLKEKGVNKIYLYVTHVINLRYIEGIDEVYCLNTFPSLQNNSIHYGNERDLYMSKVAKQYKICSYAQLNYFKL